jgi:YegS/Rv2252/BmrU family lipid kinase
MLNILDNRPVWAQGPLFAIVNPRAGSGRAAKLWPSVAASAAAYGLNIHTWQTESPLHATTLSRRAADMKASAIFVIGGDGTLNEVVNGILLAMPDPMPVTILVPTGTGSDFSRTLYPTFPRLTDADLFWRTVLKWPQRSLDVGQLTMQAEGRHFDRFFINVADVGLGGLTARLVNRHSKFLGGRMSFLAGALEAYATFQPQPLTLIIGEETLNISPLAIIMANGGYFGGGMWIAPQALPDDGLITTVLIDNVSRSFFLRHFIEVYQGRHTQLDGVRVVNSPQVEIAAHELLSVDIDGEDVQAKYLLAEILPGIIPVLISRE